jgi:hypothetical protein
VKSQKPVDTARYFQLLEGPLYEQFPEVPEFPPLFGSELLQFPAQVLADTNRNLCFPLAQSGSPQPVQKEFEQHRQQEDC